jgi:hypothetical protein
MPFDYFVRRDGGVVHQFLRISVSMKLMHFVRSFLVNNRKTLRDEILTPQQRRVAAAAIRRAKDSPHGPRS